MNDIEALKDRQAVIDAIVALFIAVDERDWKTARACLADRVHFDVTSLGAPEAAEMTAEEIIAAWRTGLAGIEAVHHQAGNFRVLVSGDTAECFCYGTAHHYRRVQSGRNLRLFVGSYDYRLARDGDAWRITQFKFNAKFVEGNLELEKEPLAPAQQP